MSDQGDSPRLRRRFGATTSPGLARSVRNPAATSAIASIERRADAIKARALEQAKAFQDRWVAREMLRLYQAHRAQAEQHPGPPGAQRELAPEVVARMASRNVQARTTMRLSKINAIKTRMGNAVARNLEQPKLSPEFNQTAATAPRRSLRVKP